MIKIIMMKSFVPVIQKLSDLATFIHSPQCNSIVVLSGAGISVASGIPDFRSTGGLYDTLKPELITASPSQRNWMKSDPTAVVEKDMFFQNSFPYLEVRRPFILGTQKQQWKATIAHRFQEILEKKYPEKLTRIYTQNIDGLYKQCTEIPSEKIVNVHGSLAEVSCESCGFEVDFDDFCKDVENNIKDIYDSSSSKSSPKESKEIKCKRCGKSHVKPKTVLFGSNLPSEFFEKTETDLDNVDLLLIVGTSLVVSPANSVVYRVPEDCVRVIVNTEKVGQELGIVYDSKEEGHRDFFTNANCEDSFLQLIQHLGWMEDLKTYTNLLPKQSHELLN